MKKYEEIQLETVSTDDVLTSSLETDFIPFNNPNISSISLNEELTSSPNTDPFELKN